MTVITPRTDLREAKLRDKNLRYENLEGCNLEGVDLRRADLHGANLQGANLRGANLSFANLRAAQFYTASLQGANLRGVAAQATSFVNADARGATFEGANLVLATFDRADLTLANLRNASLERASMKGADLTNTKLPPFLVCPEEGSFLAYKKVNGRREASVMTVEVPATARRINSIGSRKIRVSEFTVIGFDTEEEFGISPNRQGLNGIRYVSGETFKPDSFDDDIRLECTNGLHVFLTYQEAKEW